MATSSSPDREGFFNRVYDMVEQIPRGCVATYGQIAQLIGARGCARQVGYALHANPRPGITPCHRVVFADGRICEGFAFGGADAQRALLEDEGVVFRDETHVDMKRSRWQAGL
ncbi:MAG: MGMT family protein [Coriobacteriaceae bacterium]|nr:MGMT family protein [Coriobacteriaceae bacterium]